MEQYKCRIYAKFRKENDWQEFINKVEIYKLGKTYPLSDFQQNFVKRSTIVRRDTEPGYYSIRISRNDLSCLICDAFYENSAELNVKKYFKMVGNKGIALADCYVDSSDPAISKEFYCLGEEYHKFRRKKGAAEHFEIDITDCSKWLGEERISELSEDEKELLSQISEAGKNKVSEDEAALLRKIHRKGKQMNLRDIFPHLNKNQDNGLVIKNGICTDWYDYQEKLLDVDSSSLPDGGILVENDNWFLPSEVLEIDKDNDIFTSDDGFNTLVFTTNLRRIDPSIFKCRGFEHVYIIDAETEDVLFSSEKFYLDDPNGQLKDDELWNEFVKSYNEWPAVAMANPCFFNPRWQNNPRLDMLYTLNKINWRDWGEYVTRIMEWEDYVDRLVNCPDSESHYDHLNKPNLEQPVILNMEYPDGEIREIGGEKVMLVQVKYEASATYVLDVDVNAFSEKNIFFKKPPVIPEELLRKFRDLDITLSSEEIIKYFGCDIEAEDWYIDKPIEIRKDQIVIHCKSSVYSWPELWEEICKRYGLRLSMFALCDDDSKYYWTEGHCFENAVLLFYPKDNSGYYYDFFTDLSEGKLFYSIPEALEFAADRKNWTMVKPTMEVYWRTILKEEEFKKDKIYSIEELEELGYKEKC